MEENKIIIKEYPEIDLEDLMKGRMTKDEYDWLRVLIVREKKSRKEIRRIKKLWSQCSIFESSRIFRHTIRLLEEDQQHYRTRIIELVSEKLFDF